MSLTALLLCGTAIQAAEPTPPTGINLEGVAYPREVSWFAFEDQRQPLRMAYMDAGPADDAEDLGQTVLLLHGKNFNGAYFGQTIDQLTEAGYRVIAPDQVGFGKSTKPGSYQYTFHGLAKNTAALLDHAGAEDVIVLGHSMGGMLATRFALDYPQRTEALVLLNPIGLEDWRRFGVPYQSADEWYQSELKKSAEGIKAYQLESYYDGQWDPAYDRWVDLLAAPLQSPDYPRLAWNQALTYEMIFAQPVVYEMDRLTMPTLLILGTRDRTALGKNLVSAEVKAEMGRYDRLGDEVVKQIPEGTLIELEGLGHLPHIEAFDRFWAALSPWLDEQSGE